MGSGTARLFGTDGVRGLANGDVLTPELALAVARSAAHELLRLRTGAGRPLAVSRTWVESLPVMIGSTRGRSFP